MSIDTIEPNRESNLVDNIQVNEPYERRDGFYSSCGQAFIRVPSDKYR